MKEASSTGDIDHLCKKKLSLEVLSVKEQSTLIKYALSDNQNEKNLGTILSLFTGMRIGEVCGLMWDDIDLCKATIHVCHTVERIKNTESKPSGSSTKLILCDVKTYSSDRIIPIPSKLVQILSVYKADSKSRFVLGGTRYEYTDPRAFQYAFRRLLKNCNFRDINYHVLRHTFATRCIEVGVDIKSLSEILGHASVNITLNTYVHSSMELKRIQIEK